MLPNIIEGTERVQNQEQNRAEHTDIDCCRVKLVE